MPTSDGFMYVLDLVKLIREEFADSFCIAVAGFPEGHPNTRLDLDTEIGHLKAKVVLSKRYHLAFNN
jgi:methylenetetrahydrofolate reductase (NADPH)